jgi:hypothetical protein
MKINSLFPAKSIFLAAVVTGALATSTEAAVALAAPAGLAPGDQFRFVFVTPSTITATSSDIGVYNSFVNTQADGATYNGSIVSWKAAGSTATVNARDNVGGFGTSVPVYRMDGTRVSNDLTTDGGGFWSGRLLPASPRLKIDLSIDGTTINSYVWTGSNGDGTAYSGYELGSDSPYYGDSNSTGGFIDYDSTDGSYLSPMFAMSETLTVASVPEPSTSLLSILAATMLLRRRSK